MSYISEIFERTDLQRVRSFILNGAEWCQISDKNYKQRLEKANDQIIGKIKEECSDEDESDEAVDSIYSGVALSEEGIRKSVCSAARCWLCSC